MNIMIMKTLRSIVCCMFYFTVIYTQEINNDSNSTEMLSTNNTDNGGEDYSLDRTTLEDSSSLTEFDVNVLNGFQGDEMITPIIRSPSPPLWPRVNEKLEIPFVISRSFQQELLLDYIKKMNDHLIDCNPNGKPVWIPRTNQEHFVRFVRSRGCFSLVGYARRPNQFIGLANGCFSGTILHEMLHAMGLWHEHQRPDRDHFVRILTENLGLLAQRTIYTLTTILRQFVLQPFSVQSLKTPYDYSSVMHYGKSFARVQAIDTLKPAEIGQRMDMSPIDVFEINSLYKCGTKNAIKTLWSCKFNKDLCKNTKITKWTRVGGGYLKTKSPNASVTAILIKNSFPATSSVSKCPCNGFGSCGLQHFCVQFTYLLTSTPINIKTNLLRIDGFSTQIYGTPSKTNRVSSPSIYLPSGGEANTWRKMKTTINLPCGQYISLSVTTTINQSQEILLDEMSVEQGHC